ncbi:hypothetical protein GCM10025331_54580 [Actinoplanes utahensis]|uniref:hypothetical protein n=1 Tax=Actinoplanes utahensis TaxID=1869 RepID=UPI001950AA08|nr:hypothetical protein [Actinoplanes utahensis]GIF33253.1 hypothetical protein Aut01nite_62390 [Actinoplanes utahensis]
MARSIDDFYSDAARGRDAFRFDHENDDPAELGGDYWDLVTHRSGGGGEGRPPVTRRTASGRTSAGHGKPAATPRQGAVPAQKTTAPTRKSAAPAQKAVPGAPGRAGAGRADRDGADRGGRTSRGGADRGGAGRSTDLLLAVQVLRVVTPGLRAANMCKYLRKCGWPAIEPAAVERVLTGLPGTTAPPDAPNLALAVRVAQAVLPWMKAPTLTGHLATLGWRTVTVRQVEGALAGNRPQTSTPRSGARVAAPRKPAPAKLAPTKPTPAKAAPTKPTPAKPTPAKAAPTKPAPRRRPEPPRSGFAEPARRNAAERRSPQPRRQTAETCPSCGVAISVIGACRCS